MTVPAPSYVALRNALQADFDSAIATPQALPVQWENLPFAPPENARWAAFNVLPGIEEEVARGYPENLWRFSGILKIKLYAPVGQGIGELQALADLIADHYRGSERAACQFWGVEVRQTDGARESDTWLIVVDCTFRADRYA